MSNEEMTQIHRQCLDEIGDALIRLQDKTLEVGVIPRRFDDYHEDTGYGLWWNVEHSDGAICDPPEYIGGPGHSDWPWVEADEPNLLWVPLPKLARSRP